MRIFSQTYSDTTIEFVRRIWKRSVRYYIFLFAFTPILGKQIPSVSSVFKVLELLSGPILEFVSLRYKSEITP